MANYLRSIFTGQCKPLVINSIGDWKDIVRLSLDDLLVKRLGTNSLKGLYTFRLAYAGLFSQ